MSVDAPTREKRATASERLMALMSDGQWHHIRELNAVTFRYGARFWDWKKDGVIVEKARVGDDEFVYRLSPRVREPEQGVLI